MRKSLGLYQAGSPVPRWWYRVVRTTRTPVIEFLHDCYVETWQGRYFIAAAHECDVGKELIGITRERDTVVCFPLMASRTTSPGDAIAGYERYLLVNTPAVGGMH